jgi:hypothetical protein
MPGLRMETETRIRRDLFGVLTALARGTSGGACRRRFGELNLALSESKTESDARENLDMGMEADLRLREVRTLPRARGCSALLPQEEKVATTYRRRRYQHGNRRAAVTKTKKQQTSQLTTP